MNKNLIKYRKAVIYNSLLSLYWIIECLAVGWFNQSNDHSQVQSHVDSLQLSSASDKSKPNSEMGKKNSPGKKVRNFKSFFFALGNIMNTIYTRTVVFSDSKNP